MKSVLIAFLVALPIHASAQTPPAPPPQPAPEPTPAAGQHGPADKLSPYNGRGFLLSSTPDGKYSLTLSGRIQLAETLLRANDDTQLFPELYSARFIFSGNALHPKIHWMMQLGYGEQERYFAPTPLLDMWVDFRFIPEAYIRIGTLDKHAPRHSSANNILTMDALAHYELDVYRDVGVRIHSDKPFGTDKLRYWIDIASGKGLTYQLEPSVINMLYFARVEVLPLGGFDSNRLGDLTRRPDPRFSVAATAAYNHNSIYAMSDWLVPGQVPFKRPFNHVHLSGDVVFKWRGFSLLGTVLYRRATENSHEAPGDVPGETITEYARNGWGWFAVLGMMLTDHVEVASRIGAVYQLDRPPGLVATAPYQQVGFVQANLADVRDLREVVGGMSYYFSGHTFKVQADYARIFIGNFREGVHELRGVLSIQL